MAIPLELADTNNESQQSIVFGILFESLDTMTDCPTGGEGGEIIGGVRGTCMAVVFARATVIVQTVFASVINHG